MEPTTRVANARDGTGRLDQLGDRMGRLHADPREAAREPDEQVVVRRPDGSWTAQVEGIRRAMGVDAAA